MRWAAFIPARKGSERFPGKNRAKVGGASLVEKSAGRAFEAGLSPIVVSTNDFSLRVELWGVGIELTTHHRPEHLSGPTADIEGAIFHWLDELTMSEQPDGIVLLQPTSPLRTADHVLEAMEAVEAGWDSACGVVNDPGSFFTGLIQDHQFQPFYEGRPRTQDLSIGRDCGAVYAFTTEGLRKHGKRLHGRIAAIEIPWYQAIDIDVPEDLEAAKRLAGLEV